MRPDCSLAEHSRQLPWGSAVHDNPRQLVGDALPAPVGIGVDVAEVPDKPGASIAHARQPVPDLADDAALDFTDEVPVY